MIPREVIEEIKEKVDIVEVVSEYVNLTKVGSSYRALCPFHAETSPSFYVHPGLKIYHCFGCGASGDVIKFLQEMEGISFQEALERLAKRAGVDLSAYKLTGSSEYTRYVQLYEEVWRRYTTELKKSDRAKKYLLSRGFAEGEIESFGFGYAPEDSRISIEIGKRLNLKEDEVIRYGLALKRGSRLIDRFEGRLIVPIKNDRGHIVALGGRLLGDGEPKYLNSPDTRYFSKRKTLFLFDEAKKVAKDVGFFVVTEGYFDALAFRRDGIPTAVAVLGANLSREAILKLSAHSRNVILCFDNDRAGLKATLKSLEDLLEYEFNVLIATSDPYKDPDELFRKKGKGSLKKMLKESVSFEYFLMKAGEVFFDKNSPTGVKSYLSFLRKWVQKMRRKGYLKHVDNLVKEVSSSTQIPESQILNFFESDRSNNMLAQEVKPSKIYDEGKGLVYLFLNYEDFRRRILELDLNVLEDRNAREFFEKVASIGNLNEATESLPKEVKDWIFKVLEEVPPPKNPEKFFQDLSEKLKVRQLKKRLGEIEKMIKQSTSEEERRILLNMKVDLLRKIKRRRKSMAEKKEAITKEEQAKEQEKRFSSQIEKRIKKLINQGKKRGYITYEDIDKAFPPNYEEFDTNLIEKIYEELEKHGINIVESDSEEETETSAEELEELLERESPEIHDTSNVRDSIKMYLKEIGKIPLLTPAQERELARRAQMGDKKAKEKLITSNLRLVVS
ncbi:DNA primase, partial [Thermotoga sp.]|uniref:DNA primase n=1 Tax=Thermotoga sp. TaxID=28240 RepID=UPI0025DD7378